MNSKSLSKSKIFILLSAILCNPCFGGVTDVKPQEKKWHFGFGIGYGNLKLSGAQKNGNYQDQSGINQTIKSRELSGKSFAYNMSISYFFTPSIAVEAAIGGLSQKLRYENIGYVFISDNIVQLITPVSLALQYHVAILDHIKPYVGIGYSYEFGKRFKVRNPRDLFSTSNELELEGGGGVLAQVGIDFPLRSNEELLLNLDLKYTHKVSHKITESNFTREVLNDPIKTSTLVATVGVKIPL